MYKHKQHGFTIVELLIVIVVIVIVAYNGIQTKARNTKTTSAVENYVKALRLYSADNSGNLPTINSCLGRSTTYPGNGQCFNDATWVVRPELVSAWSKYTHNLPEVDITSIDSSGNWRGALYLWDGATNRGIIYMSLTGTTNNGDCLNVKISGLGDLIDAQAQPKGISCAFVLTP